MFVEVLDLERDHICGVVDSPKTPIELPDACGSGEIQGQLNAPKPTAVAPIAPK